MEQFDTAKEASGTAATAKEEGGTAAALLPSPPVVPPNVKAELPPAPKYSIMSRRGTGRVGRHIPLMANHFKVSVNVPDAVFYQYTVSISSEENKDVNVKGIGRKIIDRLYQTYSSEFSGKRFAYDGEKSLYTVGPLPQRKFEFTVVLEESFAKHETGSPGFNGSPKESGKRSKRSFNSKTFKIQLSYAAKIPVKSIALALKGADADDSAQDALRVLDIILRQQAANRGCLLVRQSFFHDDTNNFTDVGGGVTGVRGFHASFRPTQNGLALNMDVSTTMILQPGPVINFLKTNQGVREVRYIDWVKAKKMLRNMRIKTRHRNMEFKIIGLSEKPCNQLYFPMKVKNGDSTNEGQTEEITVYEYFTKHCGIELSESAYLPCLIVGRPKKPNYLPLELCSLVSLQRYTKALSSTQRASLVEKSRQKPQEKTKILVDAVRNYHYDNDPLLAECGISIEKQFTQVDGRVLESPKLKFGNGCDFAPNNGRWNLNNKTVLDPVHIERWIIVNFSARCDLSQISRDLISCGRKKGIVC